MKLAIHECCALVFLDVALVLFRWERKFSDKILLYKISDRKLIGVGQKMENAKLANHVVFQMVHHVCSIAFHLK